MATSLAVPGDTATLVGWPLPPLESPLRRNGKMHRTAVVIGHAIARDDAEHGTGGDNGNPSIAGGGRPRSPYR